MHSVGGFIVMLFLIWERMCMYKGKLGFDTKMCFVRIICTIIIILLAFEMYPANGRYSDAACSAGIAGNGTSGINININAAPYTTFQGYSYGNNAYTLYGCGWFASARANELTGKGNTIWNGQGWWNGGYSKVGFNRGSELKAPCLACYSGHIVVVEAINGNTVTISEGGSGFTDASHGYCRIATMTKSQFLNYRSDLLGYVYLPVKNIPKGIEVKVTERQEDWYTVQATFTADREPDSVRFPTWTEANGQDDLESDWGTSPWTFGGQVSRNGNVFTYEKTIYSSSHNNEKGVYITDVYVFDRSGNAYFIGRISVELVEDKAPSISEIIIQNTTYEGFDISCFASDDKAVKTVKYRIWTELNGNDDVKEHTASFTNGMWSAHINTSDHNNESGRYIIHVFAWDYADQSGSSETYVVVPEKPKAPVITKQPTDQEVSSENTAVFSVEASGAYIYQWYESDDGKTWFRMNGGNLVTGCTSSKLTVKNASLYAGTQYRCEITSASGESVTSNVVKIIDNFKITKQPSTVSASVGDTVSFTVTATGAKGYQWYYSQDAGKTWKTSGMTGSTTNKLSVPVTETRIGQRYRCVVTGTNGKTLTSNVVTITAKLAITKQPIDVTAAVGETVSFTLTATGAKSYQWYYSQDAGKTWKASGMTGAATNKLSVPVTETRIGQRYRCAVTGTNGSTVTSNAVMITAKLAITKQPVDVTAAVGETVSFTVTATGAKSYQWHYSQDAGKTWNASGMTGAATNKLTVPVTETRIGQKYRCVVTGTNGGTVTSNAVMITAKLAITKQPVDVTAGVGETVSFTVTATGAKSYQWFYSQDAGKTWNPSGMTGAATNKLTVPVTETRIGQRYRCIATGTNGSTVTSNAVMITAKFAITKQPSDVFAVVGEMVNFTVTATGAKSYQWYYSQDNGDSWNSSGMTGSKTNKLTVSVTKSRIGQKYMCIVTGIDGSTLISKVATIKGSEQTKLPTNLMVLGNETEVTYEDVLITKQPVYSVTEDGEKVIFEIVTNGADYFQWYYSEDGSVWNKLEADDIIGEDTGRLEVPFDESRIALFFRCEVTGLNGEVITSDKVRFAIDSEVVDEKELDEEKAENKEQTMVTEKTDEIEAPTDNEKKDDISEDDVLESIAEETLADIEETEIGVEDELSKKADSTEVIDTTVDENEDVPRDDEIIKSDIEEVEPASQVKQ